MLNDRHRAHIDDFLRAGERFVGAGFRRRRQGATRLEVRFDKLAGCLRTPRGGSARQIIVVADQGQLRMRWMSAIEYARLQGAERFTLLPNERQMLFGFGDAVCVPVIAWIDRCVLTPLLESK
jgi:DNA (cytosine-5)-methyltransferase 1